MQLLEWHIHEQNDQDWYESITNAGFKVCNHKKHLSLRLLSLWDIGFRPLFPALSKACDRMSDKDRLSFKKDLIETIKVFAEPILSLEKLDTTSDRGFNYFHLTK